MRFGLKVYSAGDAVNRKSYAARATPELRRLLGADEIGALVSGRSVSRCRSIVRTAFYVSLTSRLHF